MTPEGQLKKLILDWLKWQPNCYVRLIQIGGIAGRKNSSSGISDIIGAWRGKALAIEVKTPKGVLSEGQELFLEAWARAGGIAIVARSLEDVTKRLCP